MRLLHLLWPHLPLRLARSRGLADPGSGSFPTGPLVLGGQPWTDGIVLDASPIVRELGVRRGMPLGSAHRLAPEATFLDPDPVADAATVARALDTLAAFSPGIAGASDVTDGTFGLLEVQLDGLERLWGPEPVIVEKIVAALAPILPGPPRVGIAGTRFAATSAAGVADAPGQPWIVEPGGEAAFLAPLPAALLTPDLDIRARLARFGLRRIGAVAELPRSALVARFGTEGERIHGRANGQEIAAFRPQRTPERLVLGLGLEPPIEDLEPLRFVLHRLAGTLGDQLLARGAAAGRVELRLILDPAFARRGTPAALAVEQRFPEPTAEAEAIERLLFARLEREPPPAAVARLELELAEVAPGRRPAARPVRAPDRPGRTARLAARPAGARLRRGPDRARRADRCGGAAGRGSLAAGADRIGLRRRVPAAAPGGRSAVARTGRGGSVTRLLREHPPIDAELDATGRLVAIRWAGRREAVEVCNRWRVDEGWWRDPIDREYFKVVGTRWLALVYLDRLDGTWHLERIYD